MSMARSDPTASAGAAAAHRANATTKSEDTDFAVSIFGAAHTLGQSCATQHQRSRWNHVWTLASDLFSISIQTSILLVVFLHVFRDESAQDALQLWIIIFGALHMLKRTHKCFREMQSNRLPQTIPDSSGFEVDKLQTGWCQRFGIQVLKWLWRSVPIFLEFWLGVGAGILVIRWRIGQAPNLSWLCTIFLVIPWILMIATLTVHIMVLIRRSISLWAKATVTSALSTYKFHAQVSDLESNTGGAAAPDVECCRCKCQSTWY